jgi:imidazoleglycerol-phosphate dehydratase/histidinol-phosphatase
VFKNLRFICEKTDFALVLVSNQDGLGTSSFPENTFWPVHNFIIDTFASEGIAFAAQYIDRHFPADNSPMRKPGVGMLTEYLDSNRYDLAASYVIGDRETDAQLAQNLGCKSLILGKDGMSWDKIAEIVFAGERTAEMHRTTKETDVYVKLDLNGTGKCDICTGLGFFDHMLEQIGKHGMLDITVRVKGDLHVDEHHTIEDTALTLGECLGKALGDKRGIERYGYSLPMDDCLCQVALDFGGRPWLVWQADFQREKIGEMPTEMFMHFFKSLSDSAKMNLHIKAEGKNEHHKIEGIFKALARALKMAVKRDVQHFELPSTKGSL